MKLEYDVMLETNLDLKEAKIHVDPAKIMQIFSVNFYENPRESAFIEILMNAIDVHIQQNISTPIDVKVFQHDLFSGDEINYVISIRDYGKGLTEEEVEEIYTKFFYSTKDKSNLQFGAFGLGAKSPLSYAKYFIVKSYQKDGIHTYMITKQDSKLMYSKILEEENTTNTTGLEVLLPTRYDYYSNDELIRIIKNVLLSAYKYRNLIKVRFNSTKIYDPQSVMDEKQYLYVTETKDGYFMLKPMWFSTHIYYSGRVFKIDNPLYYQNISIDYIPHIGKLPLVASREKLTETGKQLAAQIVKNNIKNIPALQEYLNIFEDLRSYIPRFNALVPIYYVDDKKLSDITGDKNVMQALFIKDYLASKNTPISYLVPKSIVDKHRQSIEKIKKTWNLPYNALELIDYTDKLVSYYKRYYTPKTFSTIKHSKKYVVYINDKRHNMTISELVNLLEEYANSNKQVTITTSKNHGYSTPYVIRVSSHVYDYLRDHHKTLLIKVSQKVYPLVVVSDYNSEIYVNELVINDTTYKSTYIKFVTQDSIQNIRYIHNIDDINSIEVKLSSGIIMANLNKEKLLKLVEVLKHMYVPSQYDLSSLYNTLYKLQQLKQVGDIKFPDNVPNEIVGMIQKVMQAI